MAASDSSANRRAQRQMSGQLQDYPLPELLQFLQGMRKHVHLLVERSEPRQSAGVYFSAGRPVHAYLPPLEGDEAMLALIGWSSGRFLVIEDALPERHTVTCELPGLLLEGLRRLDESSRSLPLCPRLDSVPRPRTSLAAESEDLLLTLREWRLLAAVDGRRSVGDLARILRREVGEIQRALANLAASGLIRLG